jgi:hypothetical protein
MIVNLVTDAEKRQEGLQQTDPNYKDRPTLIKEATELVNGVHAVVSGDPQPAAQQTAQRDTSSLREFFSRPLSGGPSAERIASAQAKGWSDSEIRAAQLATRPSATPTLDGSLAGSHGLASNIPVKPIKGADVTTPKHADIDAQAEAAISQVMKLNISQDQKLAKIHAISARRNQLIGGNQ